MTRLPDRTLIGGAVAVVLGAFLLTQAMPAIVRHAPAAAPDGSLPAGSATPTGVVGPSNAGSRPATRPTSPGIGSAPAGRVPPFDHVFLIVMENHGYRQIVGAPGAPFLNELLRGGGLATHYRATTHPSLPNYFALTAGSTLGLTANCNPSTCSFDAPNLGDALEAAGRTWKAYMESMPRPCAVRSVGRYTVQHNPFVYFDGIRSNRVRCDAHVVPYRALATDLASSSTTPSLSFIEPDLCNSMHSCPVSIGDAWLRRTVGQVRASPSWAAGRALLVITFDEDDDDTEGNRVFTLLLGPAVSGGATSSAPYDHYSLLRTIEDGLGLAPLTAEDGRATPMTDLFR